MNRERRKRMVEVLSRIDDCIADLEAIRDEEQESFDNLPENFQESERGQEQQAGIETMEEAIDALEQVNADDLQAL